MQDGTATRQSGGSSEPPASLPFFFRKHIVGLVVGSVAAMIGAEVGLSAGRSHYLATVPSSQGSKAVVGRVIDGDTVSIEGQRVRLIGIDAPPESADKGSSEECLGRLASEHLEKLLGDEAEVLLVTDVEERDRYGRLLAYLYRADGGLFINAAMVRNGFAEALTIPPNVVYSDEFEALARSAWHSDRGLWSSCRFTETCPRSRRRRETHQIHQCNFA